MSSDLREFLLSLKLEDQLPETTLFPFLLAPISILLSFIQMKMEFIPEFRREVGFYAVTRITHYKSHKMFSEHEFLLAEVTNTREPTLRPTYIRVERTTGRTNNLVTLLDHAGSDDRNQLRLAYAIVYNKFPPLELSEEDVANMRGEVNGFCGGTLRTRILHLLSDGPSNSSSGGTSTSQHSNTVLSESNALDGVSTVSGHPSKADAIKIATLTTPSAESLLYIDFLIVAESVHQTDPFFSLFSHQCFWFAGSIIEAISKIVNAPAKTEGAKRRVAEWTKDMVLITDAKGSGTWRTFRVATARQVVTTLVGLKYAELKEHHNEMQQQETVEDLKARLHAVEARVLALSSQVEMSAARKEVQ